MYGLYDRTGNVNVLNEILIVDNRDDRDSTYLSFAACFRDIFGFKTPLPSH